MKRYLLLLFALLASCSIFRQGDKDLPPYSTVVFAGKNGGYIYVWTYSRLLMNGAPVYANIMLNKGNSVTLDNGMKVSSKDGSLFVDNHKIKEEGRNTNIYLTSDGHIEYNAFISIFEE